ncbi:MAG: hypothetical protein KY476_00400 [Planctomycetes bacterium]|nr:hypothetical protein [Planctomycetota bacterium]
MILLDGDVTSSFAAMDPRHDPLLQDYDPPLQPLPDEMREIIARGCAALPVLLRHIDDPRATRTHIVTHSYVRIGTFPRISRPHPQRQHLSKWPRAGMALSNGYDPRYDETDRQPAGVTTRWYEAGGEDIEHHTVTVGDLCYAMVGQIVNRDLAPFQYGGSNWLDVHSPVAVPALAAAVRKDWGGLVPAEHRRSLIEDAWAVHPDPWGSARVSGAVQRLCFYYPQAGEKTVLSLLSRDVYSLSRAVDQFTTLLDSTELSEQLRHFDTYRQKHGDNAATSVVILLRDEQDEMIENFEFLARPGTSISMSISIEEYRARFKRLQRLLPALERWLPDAHDPRWLASIVQQEQLIDATARFPSPRIDAAVEDVFRRSRQVADENGYELWGLAHALIARFSGRPEADRYREFLAQQETRAAPTQSP